MLTKSCAQSFSLGTLILLSLASLLSGASLLMLEIKEEITVSAAVTTFVAVQLVLSAVLARGFGAGWSFPTSRAERFFWILTLSLFVVGAARFQGLATLQHLFSTLVFLFGLVVASGAISAQRRQLVTTSLRFAAAISSVFAGIVFIAGSPILGDRSMAMVLSLNMAILLPAVRDSRWWWLAVGTTPVAIVLSESRAASALVVVLITVFFWLGAGRRLLRLFLSAVAFVISTVLTALAHWAWPPMRDRWAFVGDRGLELSFGTQDSDVPGSHVSDGLQETVAVNTNGRASFWSELISTLQTPWDFIFGRGVGFGSEFGKDLHPCCFATPLNEYVRILVDTGIVGLLVTGGLLVVIWSRLYAGRESNEAAGGLLALVSALVLALTESPFIYPFYLFPLTLLIGLGLGATRRNDLLKEDPNRKEKKKLPIEQWSKGE